MITASAHIPVQTKGAFGEIVPTSLAPLGANLRLIAEQMQARMIVRLATWIDSVTRRSQACRGTPRQDALSPYHPDAVYDQLEASDLSFLTPGFVKHLVEAATHALRPDHAMCRETIQMFMDGYEANPELYFYPWLQFLYLAHYQRLSPELAALSQEYELHGSLFSADAATSRI